MPAFEAHLLCLALVALDVAARALRMRLVLAAAGHRRSLKRTLAISLAGDAAASLTPYRAGGDVARLIGLRRCGVPARRAILALGVEAVQTWTVILLGGTVLVWLFGGAWWRGFVPGFLDLAARSRGTMAVVIGCAVISGLSGAVLLRRLRAMLKRPPDAAKERFRPPIARLAATFPLTLVSIAARVLVLPVLASTLPAGVPLGPSIVGSFAMLHGQMLLPAPAGAGAIDLALLADLKAGAAAAGLLVFWRIYTAGITTVLGTAVAAASYAPLLSGFFGSRSIPKRSAMR